MKKVFLNLYQIVKGLKRIVESGGIRLIADVGWQIMYQGVESLDDVEKIIASLPDSGFEIRIGEGKSLGHRLGVVGGEKPSPHLAQFALYPILKLYYFGSTSGKEGTMYSRT